MMWEKNHTSPKIHLIPRVIEFLGYNPMDSATKTQGEMIVRFRRVRGMGVREFARALGVAPSTVWSWEKGRTWPKEEFLERLKKRPIWGEGIGEILESASPNSPVCLPTTSGERDLPECDKEKLSTSLP